MGKWAYSTPSKNGHKLMSQENKLNKECEECGHWYPEESERRCTNPDCNHINIDYHAGENVIIEIEGYEHRAKELRVSREVERPKHWEI